MASSPTRRVIEQYLEALAARADYGRFLADDVTLSIEGTGQHAVGRDAVEQALRFLHEQAFDAHVELKSVVVGSRKAAVEVVLAGTHADEFAGIPATRRHVRVPYSALYELDAETIKVLRLYIPMEAVLSQLRRDEPTRSGGGKILGRAAT